MPAPSTYFKVFGDHKLINTVKLKRAGAWVNVPRIYTKVDGAWKLVFEQAPNPWEGGLGAQLPEQVYAAVCGENAMMVLRGNPGDWGGFIMTKYTALDGSLSSSDLSYITMSHFPWSGLGDATGDSDTYDGVALIASTSTGILASKNHNGEATSFTQAGTVLDVHTGQGMLSEFAESTDGRVFYVFEDSGVPDGRAVGMVDTDGTITSLYPEGGLAADAHTSFRVFASNTTSIYVYKRGTGVLLLVDPDNTDGGFGDGVTLVDTIDDDYISLATASDGSIWGMKQGTLSVPASTRVYRNDVLVWDSVTVATGDGAVRLSRNWETGGILWVHLDTIYEGTADGTSVSENEIPGDFTPVLYNQVNTNPAWPTTKVLCYTDETAQTPPSNVRIYSPETE